MEFLQPKKDVINSNAIIPSKAPKLLIDPSHYISLVDNGPVIRGVLSDYKIGNVGEYHPEFHGHYNITFNIEQKVP